MLTARQKKWKRFVNSGSNSLNNGLQGAMIGGMVGGMFGAVVGLYSVFQTGRFITLPLSIIVSGGTFGFIMGCGSMIRTDSAVPREFQDGSLCRSMLYFNSRHRQP